jgi:hypothetical protein
MMNTASAVLQSPKSGSSASVLASVVRTAREPADLRLPNGIHGGRDGARHRDAELDEVRDEHAPETGRRRERDVEACADEERFPIGQPNNTFAILARRGSPSP